MRSSIVAIAIVAIVLLYLLAIATGNTSSLSSYYWLVFALNSLLLVGLIAVVVRQVLRLRRRVKTRVFGAKLMQKMVVMFTIAALVPGMLVFTVSAQFLNRSIESWFNVRVENALDRGLDLGRNALGYVLSDLSRKARVISNEIADQPDDTVSLRLSRLREQMGVQEVSVFDRNGRLISFAGPDSTSYLPELPSAAQIRPLKLREPLQSIETSRDGNIMLKVLLSYRNYDTGALQILQILQPAPATIARDADLIEDARTEYSQLLLGRDGLKTFYTLTLLLVFLLAITAALAFALYFSERMSAPLSELAAGTRAVAQGDFSKRHPVYRRDELGILTSMFNRMTQQLEEARQTAEESRHQLQNSKLYLESILANLTAGVIAFDQQGHLRAANSSAGRILGQDFAELAPYALPEWSRQAPALTPLIDVIYGEGSSTHNDWQRQIEYAHTQGKRTLLVRVSRLPERSDGGYVAVFDDITELARAQRDAAWGEVAKRLAHEIRNPLTPIQLSAERMAMKLSPKLEGADADLLARATDTIIKQVAALKGMVDAFRDYARAPRTKLVPLDLNEVVRAVLTLYEGSTPISLDLAAKPLKIMGDEALLRQVLHNLLLNARDATLDVGMPIIHISSRNEERQARIVIEDNGSGFAADILTRAFEPYVTSKTKGTGLGLAVVKKIIEEHHGQITLANADTGGARILIALPLLEN
ncbi:sensor histidine kinase [Craterilacuibacter sinensis]|uniref:histidine kinase n=1 Tax=Craterilacuibacter sinensis TaxID=2686017 RepID=A0A845BVM6_9NEIS|nr:ATP-binding protein [Craterilacuibacter sinensis]MXR36563.1 HAMP domain-containing protein [Craterilacuibacter sinensis]